MKSPPTEELRSWQLPDSLWQTLEPMIPERKSHLGRPTSVNFKQILAGIFYVLRTGIQWQALPREQFGPPSTVYHYFKTWADAGIFSKMWAAALCTYDEICQLDWQWQSVDGAMTKAPLGGEATGKNPTDRAKSGVKRSLLTEAHGIPIAIVSAGANVPDFKLLEETLQATVIDRPIPDEQSPQHLCLDKGYDYQICRDTIKAHDYVPHIRCRGEEIADKKKYPHKKARRWVVEVTHSWLNRFRKILVRFEKLLTRHLALLQLACAYIVLKRAQTF